MSVIGDFSQYRVLAIRAQYANLNKLLAKLCALPNYAWNSKSLFCCYYASYSNTLCILTLFPRISSLTRENTRTRLCSLSKSTVQRQPVSRCPWPRAQGVLWYAAAQLHGQVAYPSRHGAAGDVRAYASVVDFLLSNRLGREGGLFVQTALLLDIGCSMYCSMCTSYDTLQKQDAGILEDYRTPFYLSIMVCMNVYGVKLRGWVPWERNLALKVEWCFAFSVAVRLTWMKSAILQHVCDVYCNCSALLANTLFVL